MKNLEIHLGSTQDVSDMFATEQEYVCSFKPEEIIPTTPLQELGVLLGSLSDDDQIGNTSSTGNVVYVEIRQGANLTTLRALCKKYGWACKYAK